MHGGTSHVVSCAESFAPVLQEVSVCYFFAVKLSELFPDTLMIGMELRDKVPPFL